MWRARLPELRKGGMSGRVPPRVHLDPFGDDDPFEKLEPFHEENFVIITSTEEIDALQQRRYLERNWSKLVTSNARIPILTGIHGFFGKESEGRKDGSILKFDDEGLTKFFLGNMNALLKKHEAELKEKNAEIKIINLEEFMISTDKIDEE